ncbi:MAG: ADP-ribosylation factor-like protein [Promethearchaeota archaeon]
MNAKISFLGLDAAGKTSIIIALQKKYNFEDEIKELKPTIAVQRSTFKFLNSTITRHDFGGQEKYRKDYLKYKERFLEGTDLIFYVIDVQDPKRYEISLKYFNEIAQYFRDNGIHLPIIVLFHKMDPDLVNDFPTIQNIIGLKKQINEWLPYHDIYFFETTIYDLRLLVEAFSFGISLIFGKERLIENFISNIGKDFNNIALLLFEENGVALAEFYKPHLKEEERNKIKNIFLNAQKRIAISQSNNMYEFSDWISYNQRVSGVIQSFKIEDLIFYLVFIIEETTEKETVDILDKFESYRNELVDILKTIIKEPEIPI